MHWATEAELKRALETLKERFPGERIEIINTFDIANVGWECDSQGALILRDGAPELVIVDQVGVERSVRETLERKVEEYDRLASQTKNALGQLSVLEAMPRRAIGVEELTESELQMIMQSTVDFDLERDSAYHVARQAMRNRIANLSAKIDRLENEIVEVGVAMDALDYRDRDAIEAAIEKYRRVEDDMALEQAHPHTSETDKLHIDAMRKRGIESALEDEVFRGTGDLVTHLGLPEITRTLWPLIQALKACLEDMGMTPAEFAQDAGFPAAEVERICRGIVNDNTIARVFEIYDAAAFKSGWSMVREMIDDEIESHEKTDPGDDR